MLPFRAKRIRRLLPLAHDGSGVFGAKRLSLACMSCVKAFRSYELSGLALVAKVRVLQSVIWSQSVLVGRCVQHLTSTHITLYQTFFPSRGTGINPERY